MKLVFNRATGGLANDVLNLGADESQRGNTSTARHQGLLSGGVTAAVVFPCTIGSRAE